LAVKANVEDLSLNDRIQEAIPTAAAQVQTKYSFIHIPLEVQNCLVDPAFSYLGVKSYS